MRTINHQVRKWIYALVVISFLTLIAVRASSGFLRTDYNIQPIYADGAGVAVHVNKPKRILGSKIEASYPVTVTFENQAVKPLTHTYEFVFESSSLLFTDIKGDEIAPRLEFENDSSFLQKSFYVRPFLPEQDSNFHVIYVKVAVDGKEIKSAFNSFEIQKTPTLISDASFIAGAILEISILLGLATWMIYALDNTEKFRKSLMERRKADLLELSLLPILDQARQLVDLDQKRASEIWDKNLVDELRRKQLTIREVDFFQAVGVALRADQLSELTDLERQYNFLFGKQKENRKESVLALVKMIEPVRDQNFGKSFFSRLPDAIKKSFFKEEIESELSLTFKLIKLWDKFDVDVKDLIITVLAQFPGKNALAALPKADLQSLSDDVSEQKLFDLANRRRLLRSEEIRKLFTQIDVHPVSHFSARGQIQNYEGDSPKTLVWLKRNDLAANPFGFDPMLYPLYPPGVARPDEWDIFLKAPPCIAVCPTAEDVYPLAALLRDDFLSTEPVFPILIHLQRENFLQAPLVTLAHAAARTWLEILPLSPDALLDLPLVSQQNLLELLCWSAGAKEALIQILQQNGLMDDSSGEVLKRKISSFESYIMPTSVPQDQFLLNWLGIRPAGLDFTCVILCLNGAIHPLVHVWCDHFGSLTHSLFQKKIIAKVIAAPSAIVTLPLSKMELSWSHQQLKNSLVGQFDLAMHPEEKKSGKFVRFYELFGPGENEDVITEKLILASSFSLARMLTLGNRLLQKHCNVPVPERYFDPDNFEVILKTA